MNPTFAPTLRQLRAFVAVYQLRKLSAAARQLHVTQSAISVLVRQMEEGLGTRLFDRTTRSLQPTRAADEAIAVAERILRDVDALGAGLHALGSLQRGRVSLAVTPTLAEMLLPAAVRRFAAEFPQVRLVVDDCAPDQFLARVVGEQVDFGIGTPEGTAADVEQQTLVRDHLSLVCPAGHPLAAGSEVRWADLRGHAVTTIRPGYGVRRLIDAAAARAEVTLNVAHEVAFLSTALWMTASGLGVSVMPSAYATHAGWPGLVVRPLVEPQVSRDVAIVTRRGRSLSAACEGFIAVLRATLQPCGPAQA